MPLVGSSATFSVTGVCSYAGPVSAQLRVIDTGELKGVLTVAGWQTGVPSGAQSGLPSKFIGLSSSVIGPRLLSSEFSISSAPFVNVPCTYAILVPSGDQVQL